MVVDAGQERENLSANRHVCTHRRKHLFEKNRQIIQAYRPGDRKGENVGHTNNNKVILSRREWKVRTITIRNNDRPNREKLNWRYSESCRTAPRWLLIWSKSRAGAELRSFWPAPQFESSAWFQDIAHHYTT